MDKITGIPETAEEAWQLVGDNLPPLQKMETGPVPDHLTVVEVIYCSHAGRNPTDIQSRFAYKLESDDQPYERERKIGLEWEPLADKYCWLEESSMISIQNEEGRFIGVNPNDEELASVKEKVIEIGIKYNDEIIVFAEIIPCRSIRFSPSNFRDLMIRSRNGITRAVVTIFPN